MVGNPCVAIDSATQEEKKLNEAPSTLGALTVNREGLAEILKRFAATIRRQMSGCPERLPPFAASPKPRIWQVQTVRRWMSEQESRSGAPTPPAHEVAHHTRRAPGRPGKAEAAARSGA